MLHHSTHPALHGPPPPARHHRSAGVVRRVRPPPQPTGLNSGHSRLDLAAAAAASTESMEEPVTRITTTLEALGLAPWTWDVM